jgi:cell wall-associated NlpC family hydrolase
MARLGAAALAGLLTLLILVTAATEGVLSAGPAAAGCGTQQLAEGAGAPALDVHQMQNAAEILQVAQNRNLPGQAALIAIATAMQESSLRNLDHGDSDSVGLFQQRPSQGWGQAPDGASDHRTPRQRLMDPVYAANSFYTALLAVDGWQQLSLTAAAQTVQRSAHPAAYARWQPLAEHALAQLSTQACIDSVVSDPSSAAGTALAYARAQLGLPYQWGGNGPAAGDRGFDCSGLTYAAYEAAGITIPRTAQTQYNAGPRLPTGQTPAPGDLVFFGTSSSNVTHVGIVATPGWMIDAPHRGAVVRLERIWTTSLVGYSRPEGA